MTVQFKKTGKGEVAILPRKEYEALVAKNATTMVTLNNAKTQVNIFTAAVESNSAQLELLRVHGDQLEGSIARICLEILADVRKELEVYRRLQNIYEHVANAPEDVSPAEVRRRCCADFIQLYAQTR